MTLWRSLFRLIAEVDSTGYVISPLLQIFMVSDNLHTYYLLVQVFLYLEVITDSTRIFLTITVSYTDWIHVHSLLH